MRPQPTSIPLAYIEWNGKQVPCYISTPWYKYLAIELPSAVGGPVADIDAILRASRPVFFEEPTSESDGGDSIVVQQITQNIQNLTVIFNEETTVEETYIIR